MNQLRMTSLLSEIADPFCEALAGYLSDALATPIGFTTGLADPERHQLLDQQVIDIAWICGLLYTVKLQADYWCYVPSAAPCMVGEPKSVYYADLVVHRDSHVSTVEALRDAVWCFNEEESFSGFQMMRILLHDLGEAGPFFNERICSGSHLNSIQMVSNREVDAAIIDSTVLQMSAAEDPASIAQLRSISRIGPFSMPPVVLSPTCFSAHGESIQKALSTMHKTDAGQALLARWQVARFLPVDNATYDDIRHAIARSSYVRL